MANPKTDNQQLSASAAQAGTTGRVHSPAMPATLVTVDIAEFKVTDDPGHVLVTYALGSCIAVILYEPTKKVGGMIHYMLPQSSVSPDKAKERPAMFADTGIPLLFEAMYAKNCKKPDLIVKVCGGAKLYDDNGVFDIGKRNFTILRQMFWKNGVNITAADVGGQTSRTTKLFLASGLCTIRSPGGEYEL